MPWGWGRRLCAAAAGLVLAAVAARVAAHRVAHALADEAAIAAIDLGEALTPPADDPPPSLDDLVGLGDAATVELGHGLLVPSVAVASPSDPARRAAGRRSTPGAAPPPAPLGILIRAAAVKAAVARGGMPSGSPVGADGARPAGLVLHGVSAYGTALRDGDVLVRVGGTPATSEGRVIGAVSGAIRSGARAIDGEVWRGAQRIQVVVELPRFRKRSSKRKG